MARFFKNYSTVLSAGDLTNGVPKTSLVRTIPDATFITETLLVFINGQAIPDAVTVIDKYYYAISGTTLTILANPAYAPSGSYTVTAKFSTADVITISYYYT